MQHKPSPCFRVGRALRRLILIGCLVWLLSFCSCFPVCHYFLVVQPLVFLVVFLFLWITKISCCFVVQPHLHLEICYLCMTTMPGVFVIVQIICRLCSVGMLCWIFVILFASRTDLFVFLSASLVCWLPMALCLLFWVFFWGIFQMDHYSIASEFLAVSMDALLNGDFPIVGKSFSRLSTSWHAANL